MKGSGKLRLTHLREGMDKLILSCWCSWREPAAEVSTPVPSSPPNPTRFTHCCCLLCLPAWNVWLVAATATWGSGGGGFVNCPLSHSAAYPSGCEIIGPGSSGGCSPAWLGGHTAVACWPGAVQSMTTRKADMLTTARSKENESFCLCLVGLGGRRGDKGVSGRVPSWAVDDSVGRFQGRHFANSEAVGLIPPALFFA